METLNAADVLYGKAAPVTAPAPAPPKAEPSAEEIAAAKLFSGEAPPPPAPAEPEAPTPEHVQAQKDAEQNALYEARFGPALNDIRTAAVERLGMEATEAEESARTWAKVFDRHGVDATTAQNFAAIGIALKANGLPDGQTMLAWRNDAMDKLRQEFGPDGVTSALNLAREYIAKDPALDRELAITGLGNHPDIVRWAAIRARHVRTRG